jgi:hypothetical protein
LDPRFTGSEPAKGDGFLSAIIFHSMPSFGGQAKLEILWHVKIPV